MKIQRNYWLKALSLVLAFSLLLGSVPNQVIALTGEALLSEINADDTATLQVEQELLGTEHIVEEDTSKRGESYKEYILNNGLRLATIYPSAIHYEDDGAWKDIDNTLIATLSGGSTFYTNTAGKWNVRFPQSLTGSNMIGITKDGFTLQFGMAGELRSTGDVVVASVGQIGSENTAASLAVSTAQTSTAQIQQIDLTAARAAAEHPETVLDTLNSRLTYANIYPNTNVVYDLQGNQLKESIILQQYDSTLWGYRYTLDTGNLVPVMNEDQQIDLCNPETNDVVLTMPAPYMLDSNGEYSYDVDVSLVRNGSDYLLSYYLPREWLADADRAWPVILDPIVSADSSYSNIKDRTVFEKHTESYSHQTIECGYHYSGIARFFVQYIDLPKLTSADVVVDATISFLKPNNSGKTAVIEVHKVEDAWDSENITWAEQPDYNPTIEDYVVCLLAGRYEWSITDIVRDWYAGVNTGMMFKVSDDVEALREDNWKQFYSSDYDSVSVENMPMLSIKFRNANGLEDYWDYTVSSAGRAGTGYVNNYNGNLVWIHGDIGFGGNRMPVAISHVYNANDSMNNLFGMGYGWRTNYNQRVYQWSQNTNYYVWEDSDGTRHYFYKTSAGTYLDEDGLYLTLTTHGTGTSTTYQITDQYGNKSYFDTDGRLVKIENNQQSKSNISITYENGLIKTITDGASRVYEFTYTDNLLYQISYKGGNSSTISYVNYSYSDDYQLTGITDKDEKCVSYSYSIDDRNLLLSAQDVDGYQVAYTYNLIDTDVRQPSRVATIAETDGDAEGGTISIEYANNQTTFTDHNGNVQIIQFNNWGNPVAIMDGEGRGQFVTYNIPESSTEKGNQLSLSSKLQNTVSNLLADSSFERGTLWSATSTAAVTRAITTGTAYYGSRSLKMNRSAAGTPDGVFKAINAVAGETYTFSAYVKTDSTATAYLAIVDISGNKAVSQTLASNSNWTRLEVALTPKTSGLLKVQLLTEEAGTVYMDCVQLERTPTASRYNLIDNGDFQSNQYWAISAGSSTNIQRTTKPTLQSTDLPIPHLDNYAYQFTGNPQGQLQLKQHVTVSGSKDDVFVLTGWAKGDSAPLTDANRKFSLRGVFTYSDGSTSDPIDFSFNPDADSSINWQYAAGVMVAPAAYTGIDIYLVYDYNVNTVWFDGIQLYKEEFATLYTYDSRGNVTQVKDLQGGTTTYTYNAITNNLTKVTYPDNTTTTYTYDNYHNVKTATSSEGVTYSYTYDAYGNNLTVSVGSGDSLLTSTATYTADGNRLASTTDTSGKTTTYSYNANTNVLEWVQYPEDTATARTTYTYDTMYRLKETYVAVSSGTNLSANYTYNADDQLTTLQTGSTTYTFGYTDFGLRSNIQIGSRTLASYTYTDDRNHYLSSLDYGNGDKVQYTYDDLGRVTKQTFEDGDTVTYAYDNNGALATVTDSATGRTTTYYYDTTGRLIRYREADNVDFDHSVSYAYDDRNLLTALKETIDGTTQTTTYTYDEDYRITSVTTGNNTWAHSYDASGRTSGIILRVAGSALLSRTYTYQTNGSSSSGLISTLAQTAASFGLALSYTYDDNGNILTVSDGTYTTRYTYDKANQLTREDNQAAGKTWKWSYDNAGNIISKTEYAYTTGTLGASFIDNIFYEYDTTWGDLLTAYDGVAIQRDSMGNPTSDGTWTYTWEHGRQLASMSNGTTAWSFTYDANGMRTSRSSSTASYTYVYNGGQLSKMTYSGLSDATMYFTYDASGRPAVVTYDDVPYYYVTNLQGDVVAILNSTGTAVVQYTYDAWGKLLTTAGSMKNTLGLQNPLRYRGYIYDVELGLYYLQSRYYNPTLGRFLNADALISTGQGVLGNNMFAYCRNNPIVLEDATGTADRACIYAEVRIDDEPWRDHSPGGGGIPRRNYSSGSNYYGNCVKYNVPLYDQGTRKLCWAYCQVMIESYQSGKKLGYFAVRRRTKELAIQVNGAKNWNDGGWPTNMDTTTGRRDINTIGDLYKLLVDTGPVYAYYTAPGGAHLVVVTGVDLNKGIVYTNNPWGVRGSQTFSEFLDGVASSWWTNGKQYTFRWVYVPMS